jgi:lipopolysaccharide export system permease protein
MRILDRYIMAHFLGPFAVGVAAFVAVLTGVTEIYYAVQLVTERGVPLGTVVEIFFLHLPSTVALTMPMATVFAALMAAGELSSHGEIVAMRAGGVSVWRMMRSVVVSGAVVALVAFGFNEAVSPLCNYRAGTMLQNFAMTHDTEQKPITLRLPETGPPQLLISADRLDIMRAEMTNIVIIEYAKSRPRNVFFAEKARWQGTTWILSNVINKRDTGRGFQEVRIKEMKYPIGRTPQQLRRSPERRAEELSIPQLRAEAASLMASPDGGTTARKRASFLIQHIHIRIAAPWAALCFAVLGFPLGLRPQRATAGIGFGMSLAVVFIYYILFNVLRGFGEQNTISPVLAAWLPNIIVLGVGVGLLMDQSR